MIFLPPLSFARGGRPTDGLCRRAALAISACAICLSLCACATWSSGGFGTHPNASHPESQPALDQLNQTLQQGLANLNTTLEANVNIVAKGVEYTSNLPWKAVIVVAIACLPMVYLSGKLVWIMGEKVLRRGRNENVKNGQ